MYLICPARREKKKTVAGVGSFVRSFYNSTLTAVLRNQGRRSLCPHTDDALTLAGSAAHGGSRHEAKSVSTEYDRLCTVKKSPSPTTGTSGHEYELYHVNHLHITFNFARWVYDLPGEICCFLRFFGAGRGRHVAANERSGLSSFIFSFSRRSGVRR